MKKRGIKIGLAIGIITLVVAAHHFGLGHFLTLDHLKEQRSSIQAYYENHSASVIAVFFGLYVLSTALSLPGATVLTVAGGAVFGFWVGLVTVSFASTLGATLAFLASRFLFRESIQRRFGDKLSSVNRGVKEEGAFYLFTLRLVPLFPFFLVNLVMGLTPIRAVPFAWVSQIGMLPGTAAYVNAGTELGHLSSLSGILSPSLIASFVVIGLLPLISKKAIAWIKPRFHSRRGHESS